jgi:hypothetical protein
MLIQLIGLMLYCIFKINILRLAALINIKIKLSEIGKLAENNYLEEFVFSNTSIDVVNKDLRKLLEDGCVFISNSVSLSFGNAFITAVQGVVILRLIAEPEKWTAARGPRCEAARILFQNLDYTAKLSQWWERLVDLTIVSLSYNNKPFCEVFNINSNNMSKVPHLKVIREAAAVKTAGWDDDALVVPDSESQRGFDSRLSLLCFRSRQG